MRHLHLLALPLALPLASLLASAAVAADAPAKPAEGCTIARPELLREDGTLQMKGEATLPGGGKLKVVVEEPKADAKEKFLKLVAVGPDGARAALVVPHAQDFKAFLLDVNKNGRPELVLVHTQKMELPKGFPAGAAGDLPDLQDVRIVEWHGDAWQLCDLGGGAGMFGMYGTPMGHGQWTAEANGAGLSFKMDPASLGKETFPLPEGAEMTYTLKAGEQGQLEFSNPVLEAMLGQFGADAVEVEDAEMEIPEAPQAVPAAPATP